MREIEKLCKNEDKLRVKLSAELKQKVLVIKTLETQINSIFDEVKMLKNKMLNHESYINQKINMITFDLGVSMVRFIDEKLENKEHKEHKEFLDKIEEIYRYTLHLGQQVELIGCKAKDYNRRVGLQINDAVKKHVRILLKEAHIIKAVKKNKGKKKKKSIKNGK